ncbi:uncharacterized protein BO97DRAFT_442132 [Aspergillus homomorphus CBS 101889]|uniref:Uncharacterized protein n=1 Tax=Aspergillus homomorphus (strain CBS 101889) TaxID=1450537 RepID=A0A395I186_ASPHC|nr:hypothetical protein BO97DRAFT_442132 [Aspergillus homomorphus CBS 101889]RAL13820.1 hypothetical protein BO97DRAFT_442132 [Aspergillus homomorphus CBS 101889]
MTPSRATQVHDDHIHTHKRSSSARKSTEDYRRYNNTINHYGRHSNDWLFGGFSLRDTIQGSTSAPGVYIAMFIASPCEDVDLTIFFIFSLGYRVTRCLKLRRCLCFGGGINEDCWGLILPVYDGGLLSVNAVLPVMEGRIILSECY